MYTEEQFRQQFTHVVKFFYRHQNAWVGKWEVSWLNEKNMDDYIGYAWRLYEATSRNRFNLTLLGSAEIRKDKYYVRNFGVTGANGIHFLDKETEAILNEAKKENDREDLRRAATGAGVENPMFGDQPISILSEKGWTPLLNDALIIGAVTGKQEFFLALTESEGTSWEKIKAAGGGVAKETWRKFFHHNQQMFYDQNLGTPRVFARELMGLAAFGYSLNLRCTS